MQYWHEVYKYFVEQHFPEEVLRFMSIKPEEASRIVDVIEEKKPHKILEIGTFVGMSTGVIALASLQDSTLVCVDPSLPVTVYSRTFGYYDNTGTLFFVRKMLKHFEKISKTIILKGFFSYVTPGPREQFIAFGGDPEKIRIIGDKIGEFAPYDLVFLDGDHFAEAVYSDLSLIYHYLADSSVVILHDVSGNWSKQVLAGIDKFLQDHPEFSIHIDKNLGFLSKDGYYPTAREEQYPMTSLTKPLTEPKRE